MIKGYCVRIGSLWMGGRRGVEKEMGEGRGKRVERGGGGGGE